MNILGIWELKKMALRNLARHKTKTVLTSLAIVVSVAMFIFLNSWLGGMQIESRRNIVNFEIGAAKLQTNLYFDKKDEMPSYETFLDWEIYREALYAEGYVSAPRFSFSGTLFSNSGSAPMMFFGIEPELEREVLRYVPYVDFGRFAESGNEIAIGTVAAEKLKIGIPTRPFRNDLEDLIELAAQTPEDADFIRSLYDTAPSVRAGGDIFSPEAVMKEGNERMVLKRNISQADKDRYWNLIAATGRNNVRVNTSIHIKGIPERIRADRWDGELMPALRAEDIALVEAAYEHFESLDMYLLMEEIKEDEIQLAQVLEAMIRADFRGTISYVNQLMDFVVVGVINSPAPLPNGNAAFIPLDILQDDRGMMLQGAVTELIIREKGVPDTRLPGVSESSAVITSALKRGLENMGLTMPEELGIFTWADYMEDYLGYEALQVGAPQMLAFLLLFLAFLGISNTILLAILERTKEIGMMRALGMTDKQMIMTYMLEAGFLGFIGSIAGIILGCIINYPMVKHGIDFSAMGDVLSDGLGFRTTAVFRSMWNVPVIIGSGIVATLLASFMAIFPTRKAVKKPITESLRFE